MLSLVHRPGAGGAVSLVAGPAAVRQPGARASRSATPSFAMAAAPVSPVVVADTSPAAPVTATTIHNARVATFVARRVTSSSTIRSSGRPAPPPPLPSRPAAGPPPAPPPPPPARVQFGQATWLNTIPAGTCANNAAPMDAVLTVIDVHSGASVTCQVVSRGPYGPGRVVDLAEQTFAQLAPPSQGVVEVRVTW